jgi:hypothetical protein
MLMTNDRPTARPTTSASAVVVVVASSLVLPALELATLICCEVDILQGEFWSLGNKIVPERWHNFCISIPRLLFAISR